MVVIAIILLIVLMVMGASVALALGAAGAPIFFGLDGLLGFQSMGENLLRGTAVESYAAVPMFILLGDLLIRTGMAEKALATLARLGKGSGQNLINSSLLGAGVFAAISGSSIATAATITKLMWPSMKKNGISPRVGLSPIAAGATLGLMIPPSLSFIIYGSVTGESIGQLFIAGIVPGILLLVAFLFVAYLVSYVGSKKQVKVAASVAGDTGPGPITQVVGPGKPGFWEIVRNVSPIVILIGWVLVAIYAGWATPSESAAAACVGAIVIALVLRSINVQIFWEAIVSAGRTSTPLLLLVAAASLFAHGLSRSGVLRDLSNFILNDLGLTAIQVILALVVLYIILGMFMDGISMMVVTLPLTFPIIIAAGFDGIWFGVLVTLLIEIGLITPPVGLNLFVISQSSGEKAEKLFLGVIPYLIAMLALIAALLLFPQIALWLPQFMVR